MRYRFLILYLCTFFLVKSQGGYEQFAKDSAELMRVKQIKPQFRFDNRLAFYEAQTLSISGFDAGVLLVNKLRLTLGYYGMSGRLRSYDQTVEGEKFGRTIQLEYGSINTELIYKDTRFISWGMPLEIAAGYNKFEDKNFSTDALIKRQSGGLMFVNFGLSINYKPMRFLGLKGIAGYRKQVFNQVKDFVFDGFFLSIGVNADLALVLKDIKLYRLKKKYRMGNPIKNAVDVITN